MVLKTGEACVNRSQCESGTCRNNVCIIPDREFDFCYKNSCADGLVCDGPSSACLKPNFIKNGRGLCDTMADCQSFEYCDKKDKKGELIGFCVSRKGVGEECDENRAPELGGPECKNGGSCVAGKCCHICVLSEQRPCYRKGETCKKVTEKYGLCIKEEVANVEPAKTEPAATPTEPKEATSVPLSAKSTTESEVEVEEEVEEVEPATGKKTKKLVKKKKPAATSSTVPTSVNAPQNSWTKRLGLPNMTNRELAIYGSVAGAVLLIIVFIIVMVVLSCKRRRQRSKSLNAADGLNQQPLSATDLPTYEQSLDSTRAATPGEEPVVVEKGDLKEKKF